LSYDEPLLKTPDDNKKQRRKISF